ncbi:MAG TPA: hypothetical protein VNT23_06490 [Gaiellaceae bacterium]|nr:hypothetical protein [Gaiellaceae bacterium]
MSARPHRPILVLLLAAVAFLAAGCGGGTGGGDAGGAGGGAEAGGGACEAAVEELRGTVSERDRLTVDQRLSEVGAACEGGPESSEQACREARADMADAAEQVEPPADLEARIDRAVAACSGQQFTSTLPPP